MSCSSHILFLSRLIIFSNSPGVGALAATDGSVEQQPGSGVSGVVAGHDVAVGSPDWLVERGVVREHYGIRILQAQYATCAYAVFRLAVCHGFCFRLAFSFAFDQFPLCAKAGALPHLPAGGSQGATTVAVSVDGHMAAAIQIADELRPDAKAAVQGLHAMGVRPILLSGQFSITSYENDCNLLEDALLHALTRQL